MWRRKLSAVISNRARRRRARHAARSTTRTKTSCWVSVGVNARKSCSPRRSAAARGEPLLVERPRQPPAAPARSNGDGVAAAARSGSGSCASGPRSARGSPAAPLGRDDGDVVRQDGVERLGRALRRRPALDVDARDLAERVDAGVGAPGDGEPAPAREHAARAPRAARPRPCAGRAAPPSRGSRCRRTRASAAGARQPSRSTISVRSSSAPHDHRSRPRRRRPRSGPPSARRRSRPARRGRHAVSTRARRADHRLGARRSSCGGASTASGRTPRPTSTSPPRRTTGIAHSGGTTNTARKIEIRKITVTSRA